MMSIPTKQKYEIMKIVKSYTKPLEREINDLKEVVRALLRIAKKTELKGATPDQKKELNEQLDILIKNL